MTHSYIVVDACCCCCWHCWASRHCVQENFPRCNIPTLSESPVTTDQIPLISAADHRQSVWMMPCWCNQDAADWCHLYSEYEHYEHQQQVEDHVHLRWHKPVHSSTLNMGLSAPNYNDRVTSSWYGDVYIIALKFAANCMTMCINLAEKVKYNTDSGWLSSAL